VAIRVELSALITSSVPMGRLALLSAALACAPALGFMSHTPWGLALGLACIVAALLIGAEPGEKAGRDLERR